MPRYFGLENRIWAKDGVRTDPDTVNTPEANLLTVAEGHIDSQGPFSDIMNWEQHRVSWMTNHIEQHGISLWSEKTTYPEKGLALGDDGKIYQSRQDNNVNKPVSETLWWIEYNPTGMGNMLKSVYDTNNSGIVDNAESVNGVQIAGNNTYYGKDGSGTIGFHAIPPDGDMRKDIYDTNDNGRPDNADAVFGVSSAGLSKYYGTNQSGVAGFYDIPPNGDMLASIYDSDGNGRVDAADSVFGVSTAAVTSYYGKDGDGNVGFHDFISQLPVFATRWPTVDEVGALGAAETAVDSEKLNGVADSTDSLAETIAKRDANADLTVRTIRSVFDNETTQPAATASVAFRVNANDDNYIRFLGRDDFKSWLALDKNDVGLNQLNNYPISHVANVALPSKEKYASEFAVNIAYNLAQDALDAATSGGSVELANEALKLKTSRTIALSGDVVGSLNFDGSQNVTMSTSVADDSHNHVWANIKDAPVTATRWPSYSEITGTPDFDNIYGKLNTDVQFGRVTATTDIKTDVFRDSANISCMEFRAGIGGSIMMFGSVSRTLRLRAKDALVQLIDDESTIRRIYHEGFKPTSADVEAVSNKFLGSTTPLSDANAANDIGINFRYLNDSAANKPPGQDHALFTINSSNPWSAQTAADWRTNKWFVRTQNNGSWLGWAEVYTEANKPTPAEIGALSAGDPVDNANKLGGFEPSEQDTANTIAKRDGSGNLRAKYLRLTGNFASSFINDTGVIMYKDNKNSEQVGFATPSAIKRLLEVKTFTLSGTTLFISD